MMKREKENNTKFIIKVILGVDKPLDVCYNVYSEEMMKKERNPDE
tara:strand:+ start:22 stop:156 length:135 start_codon:yes stop_codon:yes gene_type:complete